MIASMTLQLGFLKLLLVCASACALPHSPKPSPPRFEGLLHPGCVPSGAASRGVEEVLECGGSLPLCPKAAASRHTPRTRRACVCASACALPHSPEPSPPGKKHLDSANPPHGKMGEGGID